MLQLLNDSDALIRHTVHLLHEQAGQSNIFSDYEEHRENTAGVLLLLGQKSNEDGTGLEPCLILNKRSLKVRQPGDLCYPGGSVAPRLDSYLARLLSSPFLSLGRWKYWSQWKKKHPGAADLLALFWATALRESFEEMRLNPFGVRFLGPLPSQSLVMFQRTIYPMAGWISRQKRFSPNWEVEKIVRIPLKDLLNPAKYGRYRLGRKTGGAAQPSSLTQDYPCFRFDKNEGTEILWGATYRITTVFLECVFQFSPPAPEQLPVFEGNLVSNYLTGQR